MPLADARGGASGPVAEPLVFLPEFLVGKGEGLDLPGVGLDLVPGFGELRGAAAFAVVDLAGERRPGRGAGRVRLPGLRRRSWLW
jgi:hypothetical protein